MTESSPAPASTATSSSPSAKSRTASGISATRRSPSADSLGTPTFKWARAYLKRVRDAGQRGKALERQHALAGVEVDRRDDQPVGAGVRVAFHALGNLLLGADQRRLVDERVGDRAYASSRLPSRYSDWTSCASFSNPIRDARST